jgi:hypothetical protein
MNYLPIPLDKTAYLILSIQEIEGYSCIFSIREERF